LAYDGLALGVVSDAQQDEEWLLQFLQPPFEPGDDVLCTVSVRIDNPRHQSLTSRGAKPGAEPTSIFTLDGNPQWLTPWQDKTHTLRDERSGIYFRFDAGGNGCEILAVSHIDVSRRRLARLRLVREWATMACLKRGYLHLHAAALEWRQVCRKNDNAVSLPRIGSVLIYHK